jgi:hypothetical protein
MLFSGAWEGHKGRNRPEFLLAVAQPNRFLRLGPFCLRVEIFRPERLSSGPELAQPNRA